MCHRNWWLLFGEYNGNLKILLSAWSTFKVPAKFGKSINELAHFKKQQKM